MPEPRKPYNPTDSMAIPGFMEPDELQWLYEQACRYETVLEVGCWMGRSTTALAHGAKWVTTVDTFKGSPSEWDAAHAESLTTDIRAIAEANLAAYSNVSILPMESRFAARYFRNESIGMVFLDGEHTRASVLTDLILLEPKVRWLLCGHDLDWQGVAEALAIYGIPYEAGPGSLWYMEKRQ